MAFLLLSAGTQGTRGHKQACECHRSTSTVCLLVAPKSKPILGAWPRVLFQKSHRLKLGGPGEAPGPEGWARLGLAGSHPHTAFWGVSLPAYGAVRPVTTRLAFFSRPF